MRDRDLKYIYNTRGLVTEVQKNSLPLVKFFYDDKGQRVKKTSYTASGTLTRSDYYVRDVAGSIMAIYEGATAVEHTIYGANRLGIYKRANQSSLYELTDHLGNVRAVTGRLANGTAMAVVATTDYYPFGEPMPNRHNGANNYRYAFQGQELDGETGMEAFQLRLWDGRIGRWLSPDPYGQYSSPYLGMGNNPIGLTDPTGGSTESPIYDSKTGKYLGNDSWGFLKGEVLFMNKDRYNDLVKNSNNGVIEHSKAVRNSISISNLPNNFGGIRLFNSAAFHIDKVMYMYFYNEDPTKKLVNHTVETYSKYGITSNATILDKSDYGSYDNGVITHNFDNRDELNSAPNIFSNFEHEFRGHGGRFLFKNKYKRSCIQCQDNHSQYEHKMIYHMQIHSRNFQFTSGKYKEHILSSYKSLENY